MWRSKKFMVIASLVVVLIAGSIGGVVLAADNEDDSSANAKFDEQWNKVCQIYEDNTGVAIDADQLKAAFEQAHKEMQVEARDQYLDNLVKEGKITQDQADQYKTWLDSKPDIKLAPGLPGPGMHRGFGGFGGGFRGWCAPPPPPAQE